MAATTTILDHWKNFDLRQLQQELDITATELAAQQDASEEAKKKLVDQSKEFRRNVSEDLRKVSAPLLKSLQSEIDCLFRRFKYAESSFLNVYKKLIDLPDPVDVLEHMHQLQKRAKEASELKLENDKLRETLHEYNNEFAQVKNQEVTIKSLKEKLRSFEETIDSRVEEKLLEREQQLEKSFLEREREIQNSNLNIAKQLGEAEHTISTLRSSLKQVEEELFDIKNSYEHKTTAKSDEIDILLADLERANEKSISYEKEIDYLKLQLEKISEFSHSPKQTKDIEQVLDEFQKSSLESELAAKDQEYQQLIVEYQRLQKTHFRMKEEDESRIASLDDELMHNKTLLNNLQTKIDNQSDYEELKRELSVIKSLEFGDVAEKTKPIEYLVLEKNKKLQSEITQQKNYNIELTSKLTELQNEYQSVSTMLQEQRHLVSQLEEDLRSVNALSSMFRGDAEGSPGTLEIAEVVKEATSDFDTNTKSTPSDSLLVIVQSQRERFRLRAQDLETQNVTLQQQLQLIQSEAEKLRNDNLKLYEKIKFIQSYPNEKNVSNDDTIAKYQIQYEEKLDPFSNFSKKEKMRKYLNLKPYERITLNMGRFIMGNNIARSVTFFYTILLHVMIFLVLYKLAYTTECKRDLAAECHKSFAEHMAQVHGNKQH